MYLDSDTLLYANVTEDSKKFAYFDFTLSQMTSGCTFFLNRIEALNEFCAFLFDVYSGKDKYQYDRMVAHFTARKINRLPGGVCQLLAQSGAPAGTDGTMREMFTDWGKRRSS